MLSKTAPTKTHKLMKVPLCFICPKNSHDVRITWLKGYLTLSTYENAISLQSWGSKSESPCRMPDVLYMTHMTYLFKMETKLPTFRRDTYQNEALT